MNLSEDQASALAYVLNWFRNEPERQTLTLGGYAGTGKTTILAELLRELRAEVVLVCAYTGKAVSVLKRKNVPAQTMHSLIYTVCSYCPACDVEVAENSACRVCGNESLKTKWTKVHFIDAGLVIVDEASMLNKRLVRDLESLACRILYVGDHGQLEPIGDDPGIMRTPEIRLEKIHRQDSGSSIVPFAHELRQGHHPRSWQPTDDVIVRLGIRGVRWSDYDMILCGYNRTRIAVNSRVRSELGFSGAPSVKERLICLQNDKDLGIYNGMTVQVTAARPGADSGLIVLDFEDDVGGRWSRVPVLLGQFGSEERPQRMRGIGVFDFGYAMTVHKAQGSEAAKVAVLEQLARSWEPARWRYTAATRASKELHYYLSENAR